MIPVERLRLLLDDVSYLDWRFTGDSDGDDLTLYLVWPGVCDTYEPSHTFDISMTLRAPKWAPDALLTEWVFECICYLHRHEAGEWFQLSGVRPFDQHRSGPAVYDTWHPWRVVEAQGVRA